MRKNIQACVLAPFVVFPALAVLFVIFFVNEWLTGEKVTSTGVWGILVFASVGWVIALVATTMYGLPIALLLQKLKIFNLKYLLPLSQIPTIGIMIITRSEYGLVLVYSYCSLCVAFTYLTLYSSNNDGL